MMTWVLSRSDIWVFDIVAAMEALVGLHLELGQVSIYNYPFQCFIHYSFIYIIIILSFEIFGLSGGGSSYIG